MSMRISEREVINWIGFVNEALGLDENSACHLAIGGAYGRTYINKVYKSGGISTAWSGTKRECCEFLRALYRGIKVSKTNDLTYL